NSIKLKYVFLFLLHLLDRELRKTVFLFIQDSQADVPF
ncbi:hypothetical protein M118_4532, partial [Bacteroides fragilis str. 3783N1-2]